ncbi:hypothetical protein E2542_SST12879 [Spatholobus suberectus]|nr:hypothetical protein E2542_SST12879 [Spatholobus suberectus]
MGCGISTLEVEDASLNRRSKARHHAIVPPVIIDKKKDFENGDDGYVGLLHGNNNKDVVMVIKPLSDEEAKDKGSNGERLKEKSIVERNNKEEERVFKIGGKEKHGGGDKYYAKNVEEEHENRDDNFIVPRSPSFREYCNDYDYGARSSVGDSNDCDSMDSTKNGSNDDLSNRNNKPTNGSVNFNKQEREKKERRGRGFRNVINKGKTRGRRNLLNFACYNASNESYAESSFNKITKTA